jgi:hypothetical protein
MSLRITKDRDRTYVDVLEFSASVKPDLIKITFDKQSVLVRELGIEGFGREKEANNLQQSWRFDQEPLEAV